ncbi:MAG: TonB-dependent receptor [Gammaproteobacteria bacterium]|nr:TonB-dependent receptor [Gammaproteobacteria bacterium]
MSEANSRNSLAGVFGQALSQKNLIKQLKMICNCSMGKLFSYYSLAVFMVFTVSVAAEEAADMQDLLALSLDELMNVSIITASKNVETVSDTPATVIVVSKRQILERRYINLADLLQDLPGVDVQRNTKSKLYHNITLRGHLGSAKFLILQNGIRIDSPAGGSIPVADNFPLYHAKQVEILFGPAAALYGADAFGGVINIITEKPDDVDGIRVSSALGTQDYRYHIIHAGRQFSDKIGLTAGGHVHSADTADLSRYYPEEFAKTDAVTFGGEVAIPAAEREDYVGPVSSKSAFAELKVTDDFTLGFTHSFFRSLSSTGDRPDTALYSTEGQWNTEINTIYAKYRFEPNERLSGELLLNYAGYKVDPKSKYLNIFVNFQDHGYEYARTRKRGVEQQFNLQMTSRHTLTAGAAYEDFYSLPEVPDLPRPFDTDKSADAQNVFYENTDLPIRLFEVNYTNSAVYMQLQSEWNARFATAAGLRYDDNSRYQGTLNPRAGALYRIRPNSVLKLLYGEAFRAPSTNEGLGTFGAFTGKQNAGGEYIGEFFRVPNFDLEPEKSRNLEFEWSHIPSPELAISVGAYYAEVDNLIVTRDEKIPTQFIPGAELRNTSVKDNVGAERHYGLDLTLRYRYVFDHGLRGDFYAAYSFLDGEIQEDPDEPAVDLAYIAAHKLKLSATLRYRNYFITPKIYLTGRANTGRVDKEHPGRRRQAPGYALVNLHLGAEELWKNLSANLDIYNLFDTRYYAAAGSGSTTFVAMPQQPRATVFSLHYAF